MTLSNHTDNREGDGVTVSLPFPPSINRLYRAVGGRSILSKEYRLWKDEAGWALNLQRPKPVPGRVSVTIKLSPPDKRRRDADNSGKAVLDLLVAHKIIEDDSSKFVREFTVKWSDQFAPCTVTIRGVE